eukprot:5697266-Pyramimonas_sp.AAC.1
MRQAPQCGSNPSWPVRAVDRAAGYFEGSVLGRAAALVVVVGAVVNRAAEGALAASRLRSEE